MKKLIYTLALSILLWSCGGGGGTDTPPPAPVNNAPTPPTLVYPTNNLLCIENPVECKWNASTDADQDVITYQIEVAENSSFSQNKQTFTGTSLKQAVSLLEDVAYYWRVKATDSENTSSSYSSVYKFYTYGEGIVNYVPFSPELVAPELNSVVQTDTANLQWTADDVDNDTLTFDVYFGTDPTPLTLQSENQSTTNFETSTLDASTMYYWKVVVNDGAGGQATGQTWSFITD